MASIQNILNTQAHRPYEIPSGNWLYYQEWNRALFMHWVVPFEALRKLVPADLPLDSFNSEYYISLVAFTMEKIRPRFLPAISFVSDFDEINVRTYIDHDGKKGVYFLNIEAGKAISAFIAKAISGLPYESADIKRSGNQYLSKNKKKNFTFSAEFEIANNISNKTELDKWLTERYCLYLTKHATTYRYDIQHLPWCLNKIDIKSLNVDYRFDNLTLGQHAPNLVHYSPGVQVLAWARDRL